MPAARTSPLHLYPFLPQSNCGRCLHPTCLAFAAALVAGRRKTADCPLLSPAQRQALDRLLATAPEPDHGRPAFLDRLLERVRQLDLKRTAARVGGSYRASSLVLNCLGKDFFIDDRGTITSECHVISWVCVPILAYITNPVHKEIRGEWVTFREFDGGIDWQGLFSSRCEEPLRRITDRHPGLIEDLIDLFQGIPDHSMQADISLVLHPLPHFPILICYQAPDQDLESELTILFDACCVDNLPIKATYTLCAGLVRMFDAIAGQHG